MILFVIKNAISLSTASKGCTDDIEYLGDGTMTVNKPVYHNASQYYLSIMAVTCLSNLLSNNLKWCYKQQFIFEQIRVV